MTSFHQVKFKSSASLAFSVISHDMLVRVYVTIDFDDFQAESVCSVLDEATSAVDEETEGKLYDMCQDLGITLVSISHRMSLKRVNLFTCLLLLVLYFMLIRLCVCSIIMSSCV